jgi:hypothetical protein
VPPDLFSHLRFSCCLGNKARTEIRASRPGTRQKRWSESAPDGPTVAVVVASLVHYSAEAGRHRPRRSPRRRYSCLSRCRGCRPARQSGPCRRTWCIAFLSSFPQNDLAHASARSISTLSPASVAAPLRSGAAMDFWKPPTPCTPSITLAYNCSLYGVHQSRGRRDPGCRRRAKYQWHRQRRRP